jgi:hypothetical protein
MIAFVGHVSAAANMALKSSAVCDTTFALGFTFYPFQLQRLWVQVFHNCQRPCKEMVQLLYGNDFLIPVVVVVVGDVRVCELTCL